MFQLYIKVPLKLQPEEGFMKAETCSCYVLLINYILCNKFVLEYKFIYLINDLAVITIHLAKLCA